MCTTAAQTALSACVQGTTPSTRVGRRITIRRLDYILFVYPSGTGVVDHVAVAFVLDRQPNGGAFNTTDYLSSSSSQSLPNPNEYDRFSTVARYDQTLVGSSVVGTANPIPSIMESLPLNINVGFNAGNAGTIGDIQTNALWIYLIGSNAAGATNPKCSGTVRVWYTDA